MEPVRTKPPLAARGQAGRVRQLIGQTDLEVSLDSPSLCHHTHLGFVMTCHGRCCLSTLLRLQLQPPCLLPSRGAAALVPSSIRPHFPASRPGTHSPEEPLETRVDHISPRL